MKVLHKARVEQVLPEERIVEEWQTIQYTPPTYEFSRPARPRRKETLCYCNENHKPNSREQGATVPNNASFYTK